jgi:multiple sugar transport system substrate-binding protein
MSAVAKPGVAAGLGAITRRSAVGALAAGGLGFALFGPRERGEAPSGRLILDYWEKWTGHEGEAMRQVVDDFNASQDRLFVRYLVTGTIHQKALIAIAGGDAPDIIGLNSFNVPSYAEADAVLPLESLAAAHGLGLERFARGMRQVMIHQGKWWAVVNTGGTLALYYNKAIFRECGLDPELPPRTIGELDAAHRAITLVAPDGALRRAGFLHVEPGWWSWIWGYFFGGSL